MVAGKVKAAMGFQRSPATPKADTPRRSSSSAPQKPQPTPPSSNTKPVAAFGRSFSVYFPRASAQVLPRPPDVAELLRLVEQLQEKESRLRTQLVEQKLLEETVAVVPFLEKEIAARCDELARATERSERLETENMSLRHQVEALSSKIRIEEEEGQRRFKRIRDLETELEDLKKAATEQRNGNSRRLCSRADDSDECSASHRFHCFMDASTKSNLLKSLSLRKTPKSVDIGPNHDVHNLENRDPKAEEGEGEMVHRPPRGSEKEEIMRPRTPRVPKPPPMPSNSCNSSTVSSYSSSSETTSSIVTSKCSNLEKLPPIQPPPPAFGSRPPPPPPPPPPQSKGLRPAAAIVRRVPEVVEFYHSLMRRESKREATGGFPDPSPAAASKTRDMIGEIENRSTHLLAIKTDVETQGDFIKFLIKAVVLATFTNIEDVVAFVKWLDEELSFLVDERAVLKHFDWPEHKADAMREAAFGYCDLKKLEGEASSFRDDPRQACSSSLKKMQALLEKLEQVVYNLSRAREGAMKRYKSFGIPWEWMQESGYVSKVSYFRKFIWMNTKKNGNSVVPMDYGHLHESFTFIWHLLGNAACDHIAFFLRSIKLASVKLAKKYMKRVSSELEIIAGSPEEEELMLQGVRYAFRVHQEDSMRKLCELFRNSRIKLAISRHKANIIVSRKSTAGLHLARPSI